MKYSDNTAIIFYSIAFIISVMLTALIFQLSWPASAKIPICLTIFIQLIAFAKSAVETFETFDTDSIFEALALIKSGMLDSKSGS